MTLLARGADLRSDPRRARGLSRARRRPSRHQAVERDGVERERRRRASSSSTSGSRGSRAATTRRSSPRPAPCRERRTTWRRSSAAARRSGRGRTSTRPASSSTSSLAGRAAVPGQRRRDRSWRSTSSSSRRRFGRSPRSRRWRRPRPCTRRSRSSRTIGRPRASSAMRSRPPSKGPIRERWPRPRRCCAAVAGLARSERAHHGPATRTSPRARARRRNGWRRRSVVVLDARRRAERRASRMPRYGRALVRARADGRASRRTVGGRRRRRSARDGVARSARCARSRRASGRRRRRRAARTRRPQRSAQARATCSSARRPTPTWSPKITRLFERRGRGREVHAIRDRARRRATLRRALARATADEAVRHVVKAGDSCSAIAQQYYGDTRFVDAPARRESRARAEAAAACPAGGHGAHHPAEAARARPAPTRSSRPCATRSTCSRPRRSRGRPNDPLFRGNRVSTQAASAADVTFRDETQVKLGERTLVIILGDARGAAAKVRAATATDADHARHRQPPRVHGRRASGRALLGSVATDAGGGEGLQRRGAGERRRREDDAPRGLRRELRDRRAGARRARSRAASARRRSSASRPRCHGRSRRRRSGRRSPPLVLLDRGTARRSSASTTCPRAPVTHIAEWHVQIARDGIFRDVAVDTTAPARDASSRGPAAGPRPLLHPRERDRRRPLRGPVRRRSRASWS